MKPVNLIREKLLGGLFFLLFCFNVAVAVIAVTLAPRLSSYSWDPENAFSHFLNSRDLTNVPGVMVASVVLCLGVYFFVQTCLILRDEQVTPNVVGGETIEPH